MAGRVSVKLSMSELAEGVRNKNKRNRKDDTGEEWDVVMVVRPRNEILSPVKDGSLFK